MEFKFPTTPQEAGKGKLITYLPVRPGAGATTLACMSAYMISQSALIDFTPESKVRSYLGYQGDISATSILNINSVETYDGIFAASEEHHKGIKVFPGIPVAKILDGDLIDTLLVLKAITSLKNASPATIAVSEPLFRTGWLTAMLSDVVCLVVKPDRVSMDAFHPTMDLLNRLGCSERVKIILNQNKYPGCITPDDSIKFYSPDIIIDYNHKIATGANKREVYLDTKIKKTLSLIIRGEQD